MARLYLVLACADESAAQVQAFGLLVEAPYTKLPNQSPWLAIMNDQIEIARKLSAELALPPARRGAAGSGPGRRPLTGGLFDAQSRPAPARRPSSGDLA